MALTATEIETLEPNGKAGGSKHAEVQGPCLHVKDVGKYSRMNCRFEGKRKTLACGVFRRGDLLTKHVRLMQDWAWWCEAGRPTGAVVLPWRQGATRGERR